MGTLLKSSWPALKMMHSCSPTDCEYATSYHPRCLANEMKSKSDSSGKNEAVGVFFSWVLFVLATTNRREQRFKVLKQLIHIILLKQMEILVIKN